MNRQLISSIPKGVRNLVNSSKLFSLFSANSIFLGCGFSIFISLIPLHSSKNKFIIKEFYPSDLWLYLFWHLAYLSYFCISNKYQYHFIRSRLVEPWELNKNQVIMKKYKKCTNNEQKAHERKKSIVSAKILDIRLNSFSLRATWFFGDTFSSDISTCFCYLSTTFLAKCRSACLVFCYVSQDILYRYWNGSLFFF